MRGDYKMAASKAIKVKSSNLQVFLGVTAEATTGSRVGAGMDGLTVNPNPQTEEYGDVVSDTSTTDVTGYTVSIEGTGRVLKGNPVYDKVLELFRNKATLSDAELPVWIAYVFNGKGKVTPTDSSEQVSDVYDVDYYEAAAVSLSSIELSSNGAALQFGITINCNVDPVKGGAKLTIPEGGKIANATELTEFKAGKFTADNV